MTLAAIEDDAARWFVVMTRPQSEELVDSLLRRQKLWTFFPHLRERRKVGRFVYRDAVRPLFPRYLFVALRWCQALHPVYDTIGVSTVLHVSGEPFQIPEDTMTTLMDRCEEDGLMVPERSQKQSFAGKIGDLVKLGENAGPWMGLFAEVENVLGEDIVLSLANSAKLTVDAKMVGEIIHAGGPA